MPHEEKKLRTCDCCGYRTMTGEYGPTHPNPRINYFCEICARTFLSHCITYPGLYGESRHLFSSIGWIANMLREEIKGTYSQEVQDAEDEPEEDPQ